MAIKFEAPKSMAEALEIVIGEKTYRVERITNRMMQKVSEVFGKYKEKPGPDGKTILDIDPKGMAEVISIVLDVKSEWVMDLDARVVMAVGKFINDHFAKFLDYKAGDTEVKNSLAGDGNSPQ